MAILETSKIQHYAGSSVANLTNDKIHAGALYFDKQGDNQYVIYLAETDGDKSSLRRITTIINSAPPTNGSGNITANDTLVAALGRLQGRIASLETASASMFDIKGTIGTGGTVASLPSNPSKGDAYRVITAGTYGDHDVEVNDWLICSSDVTTPVWVVLQGNIELDDVNLVYLPASKKLQLSGGGISTEVELPLADSDSAGLVKLSDAINGTSAANSGVAATPKAVKAAYDLAAGKWTYNENTIKGVKVNAAGTADVALKLRGTDENGDTFEYDATDIDDAYQRADVAVESANAAARVATEAKQGVENIVTGTTVVGKATEATNLASAPSISAGTSDTKKIKITAGGKTSSEFTVPFATSASSATSATNATRVSSSDGNSSYNYDAIRTIEQAATDADTNANEALGYLTWGTW